jgi:hypothetical protein
VGLPRWEGVRMRVERNRKGAHDIYEHVRDDEPISMFSYPRAGYFYEFRGVEDELDPDRPRRPESWYLGYEESGPYDEKEEEGEEEE